MAGTLAFKPETRKTAEQALFRLTGRPDANTRGASLRVSGECLASAALESGKDLPGSVAVGFLSEDSDWLAAGFLNMLGEAGLDAGVACLWLSSFKPYGIDWPEIAPIVQE